MAKLLSVITGLLVVVLISVFALLAEGAFQRQRDAAHILSVVTVKRDLVLTQEALRVEGVLLDSALEEKTAADATTLAMIAQLHAATSRAFDRLMAHPDLAGADRADIARSCADYNRIMPRMLAAADLPRASRPAGLVEQRLDGVNEVLAALGRKSNALSRSIFSSDPLINEMLRDADIGYRMRSEAGIDRHTIMTAMLAEKTPPAALLQSFAEMKGRIATSWMVILDDSRMPDFPEVMKAAVARANSLYFTDFMRLRSDTIRTLEHGGIVRLSGRDWVRLSNPSLTSIMAITKTALDLTETHAAQQLQTARRNFFAAILAMLASIALASFGAIYVMLGVIRPLRAITRTIAAIASGKSHGEIPYSARTDEIGQFARTLKMFRDGTAERSRLEKALLDSRVAQETAETSSRVKSEFLANMSHELRTPLNAIIGFSDVMQLQIKGPLPASYQEYAVLIHESGTHLLNLVSDILDLAKIEAGKFAIDARDMDLAETVDLCLRLTQRRAEETGIQLVKTMPREPLILHADPRACKQILLNLLSNAVKFTRKGGSVEVLVSETRDRISLAVRDTGVGIPADLLSRIGQAFEQASNDPMLAREGTGLGLALVKALVAQHGGSVRFESRENIGTTVTVELPRAQRNRAAA
ncbi:MAG TPA: HAMP domain-containing sensor histidine kinase [Rhizomicrobium sp.]|nr:HAMP domain-containing sensor histidine kinase [Rhizomicrobium sp.]